jgi:PKD repeat protein
MKNLLITLSLIIAGYTASMAQCTAWWMGWSTPNYTATFVDSSGTDPNTTLYAWDFGDGGTSSNQNPTHQYATGGWYFVCFSIEAQVNGAICRDTYCDSLYVGQQPTSCQAYFASTVSPNGNNIISFTNYTQASGGNIYYSWDFGDSTYSTLTSPTHTYSTSGTYTVCLTVAVGANGGIVCTDTYCDTVSIVVASGCQSYFAYTFSPANNNTVSFTDYSQTSGGTVSYIWNFGDSTTSALANPTHTYAANGTYTACLTITESANGAIVCTDTYCKTIIVSATGNCDAIFGYQNVGLTADFYTSGANNYNYSWDFGDSTFSYFSNPSHTYTSPGTYTVCLTVIDSATLCTDTYCTIVTVTGGNGGTCDATFGFQNVGLTADFYSSALNNYSYNWDFGDSSFSYIPNPSHTYAAAGIYIACLTVVDSASSCTDTYCVTVTVNGGGSGSCSAVFTYQSGSVGTYFSVGANTNNHFYFWDFGDGNTSNQQNPVNFYSAVDTYYVCLTVVDVANSCTTTHCDYVYAGSNTNPNNVYDLQGLAYSDSSSGAWSEALIYLISFDSLTQTLSVVDTQTTQYGYFIFRSVAAGNYLLKAALVPSAPAYNDFLPTYYQSVLFWYDAATISVPTGPNNFYSIYMVPGNNPGGPGFIGGNVNQGANKQANGDPLSDVQVMLLNMDDSPVQYTYSSSTGGFSFNDVAYGTYKVYAEVLGKPTYPNIVTISAAKETVEDLLVVVEEEGVYSSVKEVDATYVDGTNFFPNPVASTGTLSFNAKEAGTVTVRVLNMLGQIVLEQNTQVLPGSQALQIDMNNQQAGAYILSISFNNNVAAHTRFIRE